MYRFGRLGFTLKVELVWSMLSNVARGISLRRRGLRIVDCGLQTWWWCDGVRCYISVRFGSSERSPGANKGKAIRVQFTSVRLTTHRNASHRTICFAGLRRASLPLMVWLGFLPSNVTIHSERILFNVIPSIYCAPNLTSLQPNQTNVNA